MAVERPAELRPPQPLRLDYQRGQVIFAQFAQRNGLTLEEARRKKRGKSRIIAKTVEEFIAYVDQNPETDFNSHELETILRMTRQGIFACRKRIRERVEKEGFQPTP